MCKQDCYNKGIMQCESAGFAYFLWRNCVDSFQELVRSIDWGSLTDALLRVLGVFICLTVHETCHGLAALALGDPTAKREHRLSLNPLHHIDWFGLAAMLLVGFGWAKPVPVDMRYFKKPKQGMALTALAGPVSNLLLAVLLLSQVGAFSPAVFAADDIDYTLQNGTAIIKSTMTTDEVNHALTRALVKDFDQKSEEEQSALLDSQTGLKWEYKCEGKSKSFLGISATHTDWGSINGFTSVDNRINFTHPALKDNKDGSYQVRVADTTAEVTLTKAEKLSSSITLKQDASVKLPYKEDGTLDFDALRAAILQQVVDEGTTPSLTTENTEIKYYATSSTGWAHEWVKLDGDKVNLATYPAISAGEQQIQISFKGDNTYKASSETTTVTFTERPSIEAVTKENPTFKLAFTADGAAIYDNIRQQVWDAVVVSTNPALTVDDVTIEYYATAESGSWGSVGKAWMPLEGGTKDLLTYPAIGEGTQEVRITWGGSKDYAAWQWQGNVAVTGRAAAPFTRKEGVTEVSMVYNKDQSINYEATAQALREALLVSADPNVSINDVTVEYNAGTDLAKNFQPLDFDGFGFKFGLNEQTIRFTWRGNADYQAYTAEVTVEMTDSREASTVVLKPSISLIYNKDAAAMTQQIFEYVIDWDDSTLPDKSTLSVDDFTIEYYATAKVVAGDLGGDVGLQKWVPIEGEDGISVGKLQYFYPQMGAGEQQIRVTFNGSETYRPSEAEEGSLTVKKANVSVKVHSTSIYADEVPGEGFVTTDPVDDFDIFTVYTGVSSVFVQLPERYTDNAFIEAVDPVLEKVGLRTIQDIMDKGITVGELKQNLDKIANGSEYAAVREALKLMGVDVTTLQQIINVFNKITLLDNVRIALRTPDQVGIYTVYAITNNDNYNTGFGMGALVVKKHYSGVKLDWNQNFTNGKISAADVKNFDFGATLSYNGKQVEDQSSVHYLYSGFTSRWKPYSSTTTPPTEPGRYVVTVVTLGGNYQAAPITRAFQITK